MARSSWYTNSRQLRTDFNGCGNMRQPARQPREGARGACKALEAPGRLVSRSLRRLRRRRRDAAGAQRPAARARLTQRRRPELVSSSRLRRCAGRGRVGVQRLQEGASDRAGVPARRPRRARGRRAESRWARAAAASARRAADAADDEEGPRSSPPRPWARSAAADEAERCAFGGAATCARTNRAGGRRRARVGAPEETAAAAARSAPPPPPRRRPLAAPLARCASPADR